MEAHLVYMAADTLDLILRFMRFSTRVEPGKGYSSRKRERLLIDHARVVSYSVGSSKGSGRGE